MTPSLPLFGSGSKSASDETSFMDGPTVNQVNISEFFLLLNIKLENFLITLISRMFTSHSNNVIICNFVHVYLKLLVH